MSARAWWVAFLLAAAGCGAPLNRDGVQCLNSKVVCDCVTACASTDLTVPSTPLTRGSVTVQWEDGEGCEPRCR